MLLLAADENFNNDIVRGLLRRKPNLDIVRLQEAGLSGANDPSVLEWAAQECRILLTHDVSTMTRYAYDRIRAGTRMPGIFEVSRDLPIRVAIEEILLLLYFYTYFVYRTAESILKGIEMGLDDKFANILGVTPKYVLMFDGNGERNDQE